MRWDNHCLGVETTKEMSQLSEKCDGIGKIQGAVIAARCDGIGKIEGAVIAARQL